jgi:hypothetical protein
VFSSRFLIHEVVEGEILLAWVRGVAAVVCEGVGDNTCNGSREILGYA